MGYHSVEETSFEEAAAKLRGAKRKHEASGEVLIVALFTGTAIGFLGDYIEHGAGNQVLSAIAGVSAAPRVRGLMVALVMLGLSQSSLVGVLMSLFPSQSAARVKLRTFYHIQFWVFSGLSLGAFRLILTDWESFTFSRLCFVLILASAISAWLTGRLRIGANES